MEVSASVSKVVQLGDELLGALVLGRAGEVVDQEDDRLATGRVAMQPEQLGQCGRDLHHITCCLSHSRVGAILVVAVMWFL